MTDAVKRFRPAYTKIAHYETEPDMQEDADGNWVHVDDYRANARPMTVAEAAKVLMGNSEAVATIARGVQAQYAGRVLISQSGVSDGLRALSQGGE